MNEGDLVKVFNKDGSIFGRGILVHLKAELNNLMPYSYSSVWVFNYSDGSELEPRTYNILSSLVEQIQTDKDW